MTTKMAKGFTLIELILVIVIVGILAVMTTDIMILPVQSYIDLERRTTLVDTGEMALRRMQRDIKQALPNSIRISGGGTAVEFIHTSESGRYRAKLASDGSGDILGFTGTDTSFDVMGTLNSASPSGDLVVYNLGSLSADAYAGDNRETIANTSTNNSIVLSAAKQFPFSSPQQRFFIVDTAITYRCAGGELRRYDNIIDTAYIIGSSTAGLNYKIQAKADTVSCLFSYDAGTATRAALLTIQITLTDDTNESARLIHQVHVDNVP